MNAQSTIKFANWMRDKYPEMYNEALSRAQSQSVGANISGLGDAAGAVTSVSSTLDKFLNAAQSISGSYFQYRATKAEASAQEKLIKENINRARSGLDPVDSTPLVSSAGSGIGAQIPQWAIPAGIGLLGLFIVMQMQNGGARRR